MVHDFLWINYLGHEARHVQFVWNNVWNNADKLRTTKHIKPSASFEITSMISTDVDLKNTRTHFKYSKMFVLIASMNSRLE